MAGQCEKTSCFKTTQPVNSLDWSVLIITRMSRKQVIRFENYQKI